jgi:MYXO-CTERM domain-containing protein
MGQCVPSSTPTGNGGSAGNGGGSGGGAGSGSGGNGVGTNPATGGNPGCGCAAPARQRGGTTGAFLVVIVFGLGARRLRFTMRE